MRIRYVYYLVYLGVLFTPKYTFSQKHQIELSLAPTHYYFDETPFFNNYCDGSESISLFDKLNDSWSLIYEYRTRKQVLFRISYDYLLTNYFENFCYIPKPVIGTRKRSIFGLSTGYTFDLNHRFSIKYGGGINLQFGHDGVFLARIPLGSYNGEIYYELISEGYLKKDLGLNIFAGLNYELTQRFYLTTRLDYWNVIYFSNKKDQKLFKETYNLPQFPTRYDLAFSLGVGVNLSKIKKE